MAYDFDSRIATRDYTTFPLQRYRLIDADNHERLWDYGDLTEANAAFDRCAATKFGRVMIWDSECAQVLRVMPRHN